MHVGDSEHVESTGTGGIAGACFLAGCLGADRTLLWAAPAPHGHEPRGAAI